MKSFDPSWADGMDVSPRRLREHVVRLSYPRNRLDLSQAMERAEAYVLDHWAQAGWQVSRQVYSLF